MSRHRLHVEKFYGNELRPDKKTNLKLRGINAISALVFSHRNHCIHIKTTYMQCQGIACNRSFIMSLISPKRQKLECFFLVEAGPGLRPRT